MPSEPLWRALNRHDLEREKVSALGLLVMEEEARSADTYLHPSHVQGSLEWPDTGTATPRILRDASCIAASSRLFMMRLTMKLS